MGWLVPFTPVVGGTGADFCGWGAFDAPTPLTWSLLWLTVGTFGVEGGGGGALAIGSFLQALRCLPKSIGHFHQQRRPCS